jgi:oligopeptide transport system substrate-binding protein
MLMHRIITHLFSALLLTCIISCGHSSSDDGKKVFNMNLDQSLTSLDPAPPSIPHLQGIKTPRG